jgi:hypothetical protein
MNLKIKKYLYFVNDLTNILLKKDNNDISKKYNNLRNIFLFTIIILLISFIFNIYLLIK